LWTGAEALEAATGNWTIHVAITHPAEFLATKNEAIRAEKMVTAPGNCCLAFGILVFGIWPMMSPHREN